MTYLIGSVLFGADKDVAAWVSSRLRGQPEFRDFGAIGVLGDDGRISGGVVFSLYREGVDIEVSGAVDPGFRCSPATLRRILDYPFGQLRCRRLSMTIARRNRKARAFAERLGFRVEGVKRCGWDGRQDAILYGLLREQCPFLMRHPHGQRAVSSDPA